jgi:integrase
MPEQRITKRTVDALQSNGREFTAWDDTVSGFGVRVRPTGAKSYVVVYWAGAGRGAPVRRYTIAAVGKITPERARARAKVILGSVAHGHDPADRKTTERSMPTVAELADRFMTEHVEAKRKAGTAEFYRDILDRIVKPAVGTTKADKLTRLQVGRLHSSLAATPFQANRMLAVVGSMYAFAGRAGIVPEGTNPARQIDKFKESRRERFLTGEELERLGSAIREAETTGIPWTVTVILNAPALSVLNGLERVGSYVVPGDDREQPRHDLKRPWDAVTQRAGLIGVRLHDLRHTYASFGAGGGLGLPVIGRLLGHSQASTTARYAHLDNDPLRRASEAIAGRIAAALEGNRPENILPMRAHVGTITDSGVPQLGSTSGYPRHP